MLLKRLAIPSSIFLLALSAYPQQTPTAVTSDPTAVALATKSLAALTGTIQIADVTLTGTATRTAGSDIESGNVTLKAVGAYQSRLDLAVSGGTRSDVFNLFSSSGQGFWITTDGTVHQIANHNTMAGVVWFFPALSVLSQASNPNYCVVTYIGQETRQGAPVQHLQFYSQVPGAAASDSHMLAQLSATDIYLDSSSFLPVALAFNTHPDNNALSNIPVEVDFSNYCIRPFKASKFRFAFRST